MLACNTLAAGKSRPRRAGRARSLRVYLHEHLGDDKLFKPQYHAILASHPDGGAARLDSLGSVFHLEHSAVWRVACSVQIVLQQVAKDNRPREFELSQNA